MTLGIKTLCKESLSITISFTMTLDIMTLGIKTLSKKTLSKESLCIKMKM